MTKKRRSRHSSPTDTGQIANLFARQVTTCSLDCIFIYFHSFHLSSPFRSFCTLLSPTARAAGGGRRGAREQAVRRRHVVVTAGRFRLCSHLGRGRAVFQHCLPTPASKRNKNKCKTNWELHECTAHHANQILSFCNTACFTTEGRLSRAMMAFSNI